LYYPVFIDTAGSNATPRIRTTAPALAFDAANTRLGIGTTTPNTNLTVIGSISATNTISVSSVQISTKGTSNVFIGNSTTGNIASQYTGNHNFFFGLSAGNKTTTSSHNNFFGYRAGANQTSSFYNNFFGQCAGFSNTFGDSNNFFGRSAGLSNTSGSFNNFFGPSAGLYNTTGRYNNFLGLNAGRNNTSGRNNNVLGFNAGISNTTGGYNNFFGNRAGYNNRTGSNNIFIGWNANTASAQLSALSGIIALGTNATATNNNQFVLGSSFAPLSAVPATTLTGQVSSLIVNLNGTIRRIPILA